MYLRVSVYYAKVESKFIIQYIQVNFDEADSESKTGDWWEVQQENVIFQEKIY